MQIVSTSISHSIGSDIVKLLVIIIIAAIFWWTWNKLATRHKSTKSSLLTNQLRTSKEQSEIIIQSISDGVIVFDQERKITLINSAASAMSEWKIADALGIDIHLVMKLLAEDGTPLSPMQDLFSKSLDNGPSSHILLLNGQVKKQTVISLVVSPLLISQNQIVGGVAVFRDVTQDKQNERQRADFITTASHEMRTPVAAIEGYLALALNPKLTTIDNKGRDYLEKAHESTQHLGRLFQDLLTSAKAEDGRLTSTPVIIELGDLLKKLVDSLKVVAQKKLIALNFIVGDGSVIDASRTVDTEHNVQPLYYVYADPDRLTEVITNLFDNAMKYTDQGQITFGLTGNKDSVQFFIADTGAGIPAEDIPHLFQKFYRVNNSATRSVGGNGLGLFICAKIIELYRGRIWVKSELGKGSVFYINLPRVDTLQAQQSMQSTTPASTPNITTPNNTTISAS